MSGIKPPSCTPSKTFWLELTGEDALSGHQYCLLEHEGDDVSTIPMEPCADHTGRMGPILAGHVDAPANRSLVLELQGDEKVVVPIINEESIAPYTLKPPQRNYQDNLMVAVHPTLFCDAGELTYPRPVTGFEECLSAPLRNGWVYVFFQGRLWRELSVEVSETSAPVMRDIALERIRQAGESDRDDRPPVGPSIDTLHLPARLQGQDVYDGVELAFSETQWSWQHVEALEAIDSLRQARCRSARAIKGFLDRLPAAMFNDWHLIDELEPMRARDNPLERDIFMPNQWLRDIDGSRTRKTMEEVVAQREAIESEESVVDADMGIYPQTLVPRWRHQLLKAKELPEKDQYTDIIEALPEVTEGSDVFEPLRGRHLLSLTMRDPLFAGRHLAKHMNDGVELMLALLNHINQRPYGNTAELFHNNFRRETLPDGSPNPLYVESSFFDTRLDDSDEGLLLRTVYEVERKALRHSLIEAQGALVRLMADTTRAENLTEVLRDLFDLEAGNDVTGYMQAGPLLQGLTLPVGRIDPLQLPQDAGRMQAEGAEELNESLMLAEHPLATQLLPFKDPSEVLPGDATGEKLRQMVDALEDRRRPMRVVEANVLRSISDYVDQTGDPTVDERLADTRYGAHTLATPFSEISQWWLGGVQAALVKQGAVIEAKVNQVKGAFEGFAQAAIPGRTTLELNQSGDGKSYVFLEVLDESGNTLTSGAAANATLRLADAEGFEAAVRNRPIGNAFHSLTVSPKGLPSILVVADLYNLISAINYEAGSARHKVGMLSAAGDLAVSTSQLISALPQRTARLDTWVGKWSQEAKWFSAMADGVNSGNQHARNIVRSRLQATGWIAGMLTTSIFVWDAAAYALQGRMKLASADLTKAAGVGVMASNDIIAGRILTPAGETLMNRAGVQAVATALRTRIESEIKQRGVGFITRVLSYGIPVLGWSGRVASGWVTVLGFGIYCLGEWLYYNVKDDAVSQWLRGGPFSGDLDDQRSELLDEKGAYLDLVRVMTPLSIKRLAGEGLNDFLEQVGLSTWRGEAESVFVFATPALAITGEPLSMEWVLGYERTHYQALGAAGTKTIASKRGSVSHADYRFDGNHTVYFVVGDAQLPAMVPDTSNHEYVATRYWVQSLKLTYHVRVWDRKKAVYTDHEITETFTDLDLESHAASRFLTY